MISLLVLGAATAIAALSQHGQDRQKFGGSALDGKLGPELGRHNLSGVRGRPTWWRTPRFSGSGTWQDAVRLASEGRNLEAKALFKSAYPDLVSARRALEPGRTSIVSAHAVILGLGDQVPMDPTRATRRLLEVYPELKTR